MTVQDCIGMSTNLLCPLMSSLGSSGSFRVSCFSCFLMLKVLLTCASVVAFWIPHAKVSHRTWGEAHSYLTDVIALQEDEELWIAFNAAIILRASVTAFWAGWWSLCANCGNMRINKEEGTGIMSLQTVKNMVHIGLMRPGSFCVSVFDSPDCYHSASIITVHRIIVVYFSVYLGQKTSNDGKWKRGEDSVETLNNWIWIYPITNVWAWCTWWP